MLSPIEAHQLRYKAKKTTLKRDMTVFQDCFKKKSCFYLGENRWKYE